MLIWYQFVDVLRAAIFAYSQACGGNMGVGIVAVTFLVRMAMLPLTLRLARLSAAHQEAMRRLKPKLERIRTRYRGKPGRVAEETRRLFDKEGVSPLPLAGCLRALVQMPVLVGLFSAVRGAAAAGGRFLWIRNIAKPDFLLTIAVAALTYAAVALGAKDVEPNKTWMLLIPMVVTFLVLSRLAAGIGLYWGVSSLVSLLQAAILRRQAAAKAC